MPKTAVLESKLENGLKILGEPNEQAKSACVGFFVKTGSRDESPKESGISHFLEHMMFKGTSKRSALDITYELGNLAARSNAYTSDEETVFYAAVIPENFAPMQELLSDMLRPSLDPHEFEMEKKVILEEIALYHDRPHYFLLENAFRDYFCGHNAGNSVLGSVETVSKITVDDMRDYFNRRYVASNIVLCAAGNFRWDAFIEGAKRYCGHWPDGEAGRVLASFEREPIEKEYRRKGINQSHLLLITSGPSAGDPLRIPFAVLSYILGDWVGSKMYWEIVDQGIAESATCDNEEKDGVGCFTGWASMDPKNLSLVSDKMKKILKNPLDFTEGELERAKTKLVTRMALNGELPMGRLMSIGNEWLARKRLHSLEDSMSLVEGVTKKDIETALDKYPLREFSEFRLVPEN